MHYFSTQYPSPIGEIILCATDSALTGLWIEGQRHFMKTTGNISLQSAENKFTEDAEQAILIRARMWLDAYFTGQKPSAAEIPLAPAGSEFQRQVWKLLCKIPYGTVTTYGTLAKEIARLANRKSMSAQAIGGAVGRNPLSIIIPCHRVIGSNGSLTGYAGGILIKKKLLEFEGADISDCFVPKSRIRDRSW